MKRKLARRRFLVSAAGIGSGIMFLPGTSATTYVANEKLNIAFVGCGGRTGKPGNLLDSVLRIGENVVAMCDVDERKAATAFAKVPDVPKHRDYRKMLEENDPRIDAVIVATCDHHHAACSALAMKLGMPVYCEKPLTQTVGEARQIRRIAQETGVPTQMGNQGTASDAFREQVEILQTGGLGEVREVYVWQRMGNTWHRGDSLELPVGEETPPATLAWQLWLGPRAYRAYNGKWMQWHSWRDFGTGQVGNWASHAAAAQFRGINLDTIWDADATSAPRIRVRPKSAAPSNAWSFPAWEVIDYEFPARGPMPPVVMHWFNGDEAPDFPENIEALAGEEIGGSGCLVVGTRGKILASGHNSAYRLLQHEKADPVSVPAPYLPRHGSHEREFFDSVRGKVNQPFSNFDFASREIEMLLLGNVATLLGREIEYDPIAGVCPGDGEATAALDYEHREGWRL